MSFVESSAPFSMNGTTNVTVAAGAATVRKIVKTVIINNKDTADVTVICEFVRSATAYQIFKITLATGDTLVQDVPVVLDNGDTLRVRLAGAATTTNPQGVGTLATVDV